MKRIKLFTALLLAAAMVLPMAGCGKGKPKDGGEASPASCAAAGEYEVYSMTTGGPPSPAASLKRAAWRRACS
jgi:ABC-type glycerol-3-phosphate transport system substrate-binding protein